MILNRNKKILSASSGFAMLFTILIMSIILSIAIGISNVTFKQNLLSSIAKDSQIAFYAADAGIECGLYYDITAGLFPKGTTTGVAPVTLACGANLFALDTNESRTDFIVYKETTANPNLPCRSIVFDKTDAVESKVQSRGYNMCSSSPKQVERALEVTY